jgi:DNA-binding LytR/AlgR family response regulator
VKILIVEDEPPIADHIKWMCQNILKEKLVLCKIIHSLESALIYLQNYQIDLLFLDLNLEGESGFDILKQTVSESFHTIIISAFTEQAITAFQYGVLDFISKPFEEERLKQSFDRYFNLTEKRELETNFLAIRENNNILLIKIEEILFFKSAGNYIEAHLKNGDTKLIIKAMNKLEQILPSRFIRIHKSYILDITEINSYKHSGGGLYHIELKNGKVLPLSRLVYKKLKFELAK